jgi:hypothetical protein
VPASQAIFLAAEMLVPATDRRGLGPAKESPALPRKRDIEAAIAAYNDTDPEALLPPDAARLLAVMFPRDTVFRGSMPSLMAEGFDRNLLRKLLGSLVDAGFLSKQLAGRGWLSTYHLYLPPRRRR